MKDFTSEQSSLYSYHTSRPTTTFPGFRPQDEAVKEFTQRKREKNSKGVYNQKGKRQGPRGPDTVRMDIIEDNLLLIADATKGIQIVKPYALKVINLANEDTRAKMVKLVAYSLVKKGYGYNLYQQFIDQQNSFCLMQTCQKYKSTTISIMQRAFRRLEEFLRVQCEKRVKPLRHEQIRCLIRYLTKFNIYLKKNDAATTAKLVSLKQELHPVSLSSNQAISLYSSILDILKTVLTGGAIKPAVDQPNNNQPPRKKKKWGAKHDEQLVQFYQLNQSYSKIHKCFITIHPELSQDINQEFLQHQMERIFRQTLTKVRQCTRKEVSGQLIQLGQNKTNYIMKSPACRQLRLTLLDFREIDQISDQAALSNIVNTINHKFDFNPINAQKKVAKSHKGTQIFETPLFAQPKRHEQTLEQEQAQDWSKNLSMAPVERLCIKSNRYQNRNIPRNVMPNRFEANSEEEYSDSC